MNKEKVIRKVLIWLPSIMLSMIFVQNGIGKIFQSNEMDKVITNNAIIITVGIILIIATALFLLDKTIILGTAILSFYMTFIVFIHMYKGKPFEVTVLIIMATVFAAYLRKPELFKNKN